MPSARNVGKTGLAIALLIGGAWEGIRYVAYMPTPDDVPTICRGHTAGVHMGDTATPAQCEKWFAEEMAAALAVVDRRVKVKLTEGQRGALASFVFNMGEPAFAKSIMLREFNAGNITTGCVALMDWRYQGKKMLPGLVSRRQAELRYCLGVDQ